MTYWGHFVSHLMVKFFKVHSNFTHGVTEKNQEYPEIPVI